MRGYGIDVRSDRLAANPRPLLRSARAVLGAGERYPWNYPKRGWLSLVRVPAAAAVPADVTDPGALAAAVEQVTSKRSPAARRKTRHPAPGRRGFLRLLGLRDET
jgi:hypothetical protein